MFHCRYHSSDFNIFRPKHFFALTLPGCSRHESVPTCSLVFRGEFVFFFHDFKCLVPFSTVGQLLTRTGCFSLVVNNGSDQIPRSEFGTLKSPEGPNSELRRSEFGNSEVLIWTMTVLSYRCMPISINKDSAMCCRSHRYCKSNYWDSWSYDSDHEFGPCPDSVKISNSFRLGQIPPSNLPE